MDRHILDAFDLSGRVAVVTGAGSGIGRAAADTLRAAGATVVGGDLDGADVRCDVSVKADVDALAEAAGGRIDVWCNVAGVPSDGPVEDITEAEFDRVFSVNVKGVLFGCQAALRVMREQGSGSIVNVSSTAIDAPAPRYGLYSMSKAAVAQLTKTLALEAGRHGVRVNTVAPGATLTAMTDRHLRRPDGSIDQERYDAFVELMRKQSPLRIVGDPMDQAYLILYLASDAARFCTGQIWRANGGQAIV